MCEDACHTFEHAARAPVRAWTGPGLLKYRVRYLQAASFTPLEYRTRLCSRYSRASVFACRSQLVSSAQRGRIPLEQIWFDTVFQFSIHLVLFFSIILEKAENIYFC